MRSRAQHAQTSSLPRLGEPDSPERMYVSLKPNPHRLSEKLVWQQVCVSANLA